jgi:hypothetical protein
MRKKFSAPPAPEDLPRVSCPDFRGKLLPAIFIWNPNQTADNLCLGKGYDFERARLEVREHGLQPHIRSRGGETAEKFHPARR